MRVSLGRLTACGLVLLGFGALIPFAAAQQRQAPADSLLQTQRALDETLKQERREQAPLNALLDWQWGGWIDYYVFHFDDGVQSQRVLQRPGMSAWTRLRIDDGAHEFFARIRLRLDYFDPGDEFDRQEDWVGPNFDRAWYQLDLNKALHLDNSAPLSFKTRIGRQDVQFGTGYALDLPLDAVVLDFEIQRFRAIGLLGKTPGSTPNVDRSAPVDSHSNRHFYGVQLQYEGIQNHVPFAYALWQQDHTDERPKDFFQEYNYESQYFGIGSRGQIVRNLNYWAEGVWESGRSYGDGQFLRQDYIAAYGWDAGLEYLFGGDYRPRLAGEYMFGSGDSGRIFSPTNALGGNRGDRKDSSFVGFGYRDTGISAALATSNIHVFKASGSVAPAPNIELLRDLELGTNWYLYYKNKRHGAVSDTLADEYSGYAGWEMDYYANWRIDADLSWTIRWGMFFPGSAFSDRDSRSFLVTGLTWSF
ncbi:MAG: alginate export family protein [Phycisphaerae bacterium]